MRIVAADIGGTHARFALAELRAGAPPRLGPMRKYRTREHDGLAAAWTAFARDSNADLPRAAAFGVATAIEGDVLRFVNSPWAIDRRTLARDLGLDRALVLNDFAAVAHAVSVLPPAAFRPLCGPIAGAPPTHGPVSVIGPGTGLGVALLLNQAGAAVVIATEAGHVAFAPQTQDEGRIARRLRARYGRCSVERIVSGPGLSNIHAALGGKAPAEEDLGALWARAIDGSDPLAAQALDLLVGAFGAAAGDVSLAHGSMTLVVTGGLANRISDRLAGPAFAARFAAKGRYTARMERVSVLLATDPEPGLLGAAVAFQRSRSA